MTRFSSEADGVSRETKKADAAKRAGSYMVIEALYEAARGRIGTRSCLHGRYKVRAYKGSHCLLEKRRHNL